MSKGRMPGSMDLLLDTMCNTFGGVVFIALSLSLAFFVSRSQSSPAENLEKMKQELKERQQETALLEAKRSRMVKSLDSVKEFSSKFRPAKTDLPETVTKLEQDCKDLQRETEMQKMAQIDLERKMKQLEQENQAMGSEILGKNKQVTEMSKTQAEEYNRLCLVADTLNETLQRTPEQKLHFSNNQRTASSPYILLVRNNQLYRLGSRYLHSSREVTVKRFGNMLLLTGVHGTWLASLTAADIQPLFKDFNKSSSFLWIMVHPDSFVAFVDFRRLLRNASLPVYWYINTASILYLVDHSDYSSSY